MGWVECVRRQRKKATATDTLAQKQHTKVDHNNRQTVRKSLIKLHMRDRKKIKRNLLKYMI